MCVLKFDVMKTVVKIATKIVQKRQTARLLELSRLRREGLYRKTSTGQAADTYYEAVMKTFIVF